MCGTCLEDFNNNTINSSSTNYFRKKVGKSTEEIIKSCLSNTINKCKNGGSIVIEIPTNNYSQINITSAKYLIECGFQGVYLSFQRPFKNISSIFKNNGIDTNKLIFMDLATQCTDEKSNDNYECVDESMTLNIENICKTVNSYIEKLNSSNIFILIDSLNTLALYKSPEDIIQLADTLSQNIKNKSKKVFILFNVADDLCQKDFIKEITVQSDETINVVKYIEKYTDDVIHPGLLT